MKLGFIVNDISTELPEYTTTRLALAAAKRGHEVWTIGIGDLAQLPSGAVAGLGYGPGDKKYRSLASFGKDLLGGEGRIEKVVIDDLDVLMLRNDPADDATDRPWAQTSGVLFGQLAAANGVLVVNDPVHLANAINKTYFQHFPEEVRPETLISRNVDDLKEFVSGRGGSAVLKPLQGSGGQGVFVVRGKGPQNVTQIIETLTRDGFVVAQEYLKEAEDGDVRLFVMNGRPLMVDDAYAAFRRHNATDDPRSNMHAGGKAKRVKVTAEMLRLVEMVRPKLIDNGMFLVGLDIVGTKLMEVNVFSPGGLGSLSAMYEVDFAAAVVEALEKKVALRESYGPSLPNAALATL
ncbi:glutathione synthase [soil metagenome]